MNKKILTVLLLVAFSIILIFALAIISHQGQGNGFNRKIIQSKVVMSGVYTLPDKSFSFADKPGREVFLHSYKDPFRIYLIDSGLSKLSVVRLNTPESVNAKSNYFKLAIDRGNMYLTNAEGQVAVMDKNESKFFNVPVRDSDQALFLSPISLVVRSLERSQNKQSISLLKIHLQPKSKIVKRFELPRHADGFFGNDGRLVFDRKSAKLLYLYSYLGAFVCLDTNLNVVYTAKTIDTVTSAIVKVAQLSVKLKDGLWRKKTTQSAPPQFVNLSLTADGNRIYILSGLRAENESAAVYNQNQPVDVYDVRNGKYQYSFYIPRYKHFRPRKIEISGNKLFAIFNTYLITYRLQE